MKNYLFIFSAVMLVILTSCSLQSGKDADRSLRMQRYNVVWNSPSKDVSGVMPIGNGDLAAGVYTIENGDLFLLMAKNDAYNYMGDLFKTGKVRVSLDPNPFIAGKPFRQTLDLATGSVLIEADKVKVRIWTDANHPVCHIEIESPNAINIKVRPEFWKRFDACSYNVVNYYTKSVLLKPGEEPTQNVKLEKNGRLIWYFAVGDRSIYEDDLKYYQIEQMAAKFPDPFRFNTFGNMLECPELQLKNEEFTGSGKKCDIRIHSLTMQTPDPEKWIGSIEKLASRPVNIDADWKDHCTWWSNFWDRSWIVTSDNTVPVEERGKLSGEASPDGVRKEQDGASLTAQSYNVFRYLMACQSRGKVQVKFNGGLFTQQLLLKSGDKSGRTGDLTEINGSFFTHEDDRLWGRRFTYQNQRLLYWPLLASGDYDLMNPFISYYSDLLPVRKAITQAWFGHDGAYYRENIEPTGAERDCGMDGRPPRRKPGEPATYYHDYYFTSGLETLAMMIDYANYSGDVKFRDSTLVCFAREVLLFYDKHYPHGADGKLIIDPVQVLETWWHAVNSSTDIAGLRFCLDELLAMKAGSETDQKTWTKFRSEIPEIPMQTIDGKQAIAPAAKWDLLRNAENGELYPVFPFRCFGLGSGTADIVDWTMKHRSNKDMFNYACWTQDQIHWAFAGNAAECAKGLVARYRNASTQCRFPLFGKEGPDSCPDLDHFGSGSTALQRMIVQESGSRILLLPAWPASWDLDFKLHLSGNSVISGTVKDGKLVKWDIKPATRKSDVVIYQPQSI